MSYHLKNIFGEENILKLKFYLKNYKEVLKAIDERRQDELDKAEQIGVYEYHISGRGTHSDPVQKHAFALMNITDDRQWCEVAEQTIKYFMERTDRYYNSHKEIISGRYNYGKKKKTLTRVCQDAYVSPATLCRCEQDIIMYAGILAYELGLMGR